MTSPTKEFVPKEFPAGSLTQLFGENPSLYQRFGLRAHSGVDIVAEWDSPVYAVESGIIAEVKRSPDGYGRHIRLITDGDTAYEWVYGHLEQQLVKVGDRVKEGQQIGTMGNTGFVVSDMAVQGFWGVAPATTRPGTHLHLGVRKVRRTATGWTYPGSTVKIQVLGYDNGYKGAFDPLPLLTGVKAPAKVDDPVLVENLGKQITLLEQIVALYKKLIKAKNT